MPEMNRRRFLAVSAAAAVTAGLGRFVGEAGPIVTRTEGGFLVPAEYAEGIRAEMERRFAAIYARELDRYLMEGDGCVPPPRGFLSVTGGVS